MIDSHCHLDLFEEKEIKDILTQAEILGIKKILIPGILPQDVFKIQTLIRKNTSKVALFGSLGLHPWFQDKDFLKVQVPIDSEIIAIGEVGFDKKNPNLQLQEDVFRFAIDLAQSSKKFLIIHLVHYPERALKILHEVRNVLPPFILHSWSKNLEITKKFLDYENAYFSFSGSLITSPKIQSVFKIIPNTQILLETDAPDQYYPDATFERGKERNNTPLNIAQIYGVAQNLKPQTDLTIQIQENFNKLTQYSSK